MARTCNGHLEKRLNSAGIAKGKPLKTTQGNKIRYRAAKMNDGTIIYEINTNYYKSQIYNNLKIPRKDGEKVQRAGFCEFPRDYGEKYFKML